jgi:PKD repeat protein
MLSLPRTAKSILLLWTATVLVSLVLIVIAGSAAGDGTVLVNLGEDIITQEDRPVTFTPWVSYTGSSPSLSYTWDFGDGTTSTVERPTHTYSMAGNYTVSLGVSDPDGTQDSDSMYVVVLNVRPIADAGANRTIVEGTTVQFDGGNSWDTTSDLPLLTYEWDFGDGSAGTGISQENKVVTHTYSQRGVYIVRLVVRDDDWQESNSAYFESQLITITGAAACNGTVYFSYGITNGSSSGNGTGGNGSSPAAPSDIYWEFGDGSSGEGNEITHTFPGDGVYVVTLILTDNYGSLSIHTILVTVLNAPPVANAGGDKTANEDQTITFQGSGYDHGGGALAYHWDFGDGHSAETATATHAYTAQGTYAATLTVTDDVAATGTDSCQVSISNVAPTAGLTTDATTAEGDIIGFDGSTSTDTSSDLPLLTYLWDFGDGSTEMGIVVSHSYADNGDFTATLTVTDDDGAQDVTTIVMSIVNAPPSATIDGVTCVFDPILPNDNISFSGSGTDPGTGDVLTYQWSFGDGNSTIGTSAIHSYNSSGSYTVTLTVSDDDGGIGVATTTVSVAKPSTVAQQAMEEVEAANATNDFTSPKEKGRILTLFGDLITHLDAGIQDKSISDVNKLIAKAKNKVTNATLRQSLLDQLAHIKLSIS